MIYRHKDDCLLYPLDSELKTMIDSITKHKDVQSKKFGWEFLSQTTLRQAPIVQGGMGSLVWVISFRMPENLFRQKGLDKPDIPVEQMPLSGA